MMTSLPATSILVLDQRRLRSAPPRLDWPAALGFWLTFAKIPFSVLAVLLVLAKGLATLNALIVLTISFDILDGYVFGYSAFSANRTLRESRRIWDSVLDRAFMFAVLIPLLLTTTFPAYAFFVIFLRETAVWIVTGLPYLRNGFVHKPNLFSKIGVTLAGLEVIRFDMVGQLSFAILAAFVAFSVAGIVLYIRRPERI
jgi:phosphatidylglycerophosphate synthase